MKITHLAVATIAAVALAAPAASAQPVSGADGPQPDLEALADQLELTRDQLASIRKLADAGRKQEIALRAEMETLELDLRRELSLAAPDEARVATWADRLGVLDGNARKGRILTWLRLRKVLTPRQQKRLETLRGGPPASVASGNVAPGALERLRREDISRGISAVRDRVKTCGHRFHYRGTAKATIVIAPSGRPSLVTIDSAGAASSKAFDACMAAALKAATFPAARESTTVNYPFVFTDP